MEKIEWEYYRQKKKEFLGREVHVDYHWNFGTTAAKRRRELEGRLGAIDQLGVRIEDKRLSYRVIDDICEIWEAYEPDGFVWLRDGDGTLYSTTL